MPAQELAVRTPRSCRGGKASPHALAMLRREPHFIGSREFNSTTESESRIGQDREVFRRRLAMKQRPAVGVELPSHLAHLCYDHLLTPDDEQSLFRLMNWLKYRANVLRSRLQPSSEDRQIEAVSELLREADDVRDHLVHSNVRLVISIARKHVTPQFCFDDLLSEGLQALAQAVEKFDYERGFRFSTYAFRVVSRSMFRLIQTGRRDMSRFVNTPDPPEQAGSTTSQVEDAAKTRVHDLLRGLLERLDRREQFIIRCRYALGAHRRTHTLQGLAKKLGVSKERVRQLEKRAIQKLSTWAAGALDDEALLQFQI